jgi:hypothetical protein
MDASAFDLQEFPALHALVRMIKLMILGTTRILALVAAITKGDWVAVPLELSSSGSFDGTRRVTEKTEITRSTWGPERVYARYQDMDEPTVEKQNSPEHPFGRLWDIPPGKPSFRCSIRNRLYASIGVRCIGECGPEPHKASKGTRVTQVLYKRPRVMPVSKTYSPVAWTATAGDHQCLKGCI